MQTCAIKRFLVFPSWGLFFQAKVTFQKQVKHKSKFLQNFAWHLVAGSASDTAASNVHSYGHETLTSIAPNCCWVQVHVTPILAQPLLTDPYVQLCDNDPATHAINKGSGKHQPLNNLIGSHWAWHNRQQLTQILKRVPSKANIADPFSRRDFTIAESLGWKTLQAPTEHLIPTVHKIVGNATFAHQQGFTNNSAIQQFRMELTKWTDQRQRNMMTTTLCVNHMLYVVATTGKNRRRGLVLTQISWQSHT